MWKLTTTSIDPTSSFLIHNSPLSTRSCSSTGHDSLENFMLDAFAEDGVANLDNSITHSSNDAGKPRTNTSQWMIPNLQTTTTTTTTTTNSIPFPQNLQKNFRPSKLQNPQKPPTTISFKSSVNRTSVSSPVPSSALLQQIDSNSSIMMQYDSIKTKKPAPVPSFKSKIKTDRKTTKKTLTPPKTKTPSTKKTTKSVTNCSSNENKKKRSRKCPKDQYTQDSYENKKQKAKDNRAKLTEAISLLEDAFRQARSGSEQRSQIHKQQQLSLSSSSPSQDAMNDVIQTAMNSHKWDRPTFIMNAADIIVKLNAQCQELMQDLLEFKKQSSKNNDNIHVDQNNQYCTIRTLQGSVTPSYDVSRSSDRSLQLMEMNNTVIQKNGVFDGSTLSLLDIPDSIIKEIAYFLDPKSLLRCKRVTKLWNNFENSMDIFTHDDIWLDLCKHRYGTLQVQNWKNAKNICYPMDIPIVGNNENHGMKSSSIQQYCSAMKMYRDMDTANWKPAFPYTQGELYLGDAKMNYNSLPILSAWTSIVDRSNGETLRTVFANLGVAEQILLLPVVEVRILLQNTGFPGQNKCSILIPEQTLSVQSRDNHGEMFELQSDKRLSKRVFMGGKGGSSSIVSSMPPLPQGATGGLCHLNLYEVAELRFHVHAPSCLSTKDFVDSAKSLKLLVNILGNTVPFHIPFRSQ